MAWVLLLLPGWLETVWAASMTLSGGFSRPGPSMITAVTAPLSFWLLAAAMRGMPLGTAYPVWVGIGSVAVGAIWLGEGVTGMRMLSVGLIVACIVGLYISQEAVR